MKEIIATPTSLKIGNNEIPLNGRVEFEVGSYEEGTQGPSEFYWEYARKLAKGKGIEFDKILIAFDGSCYYFMKKDDESPLETIPKILVSEVEASIPKYAKFLRIRPEPVEDWVSKVLKPLEERINALDFPGLKAFVSTRPSPAMRGPREPITTGLELALLADYQIKIEY